MLSRTDTHSSLRCVKVRPTARRPETSSSPQAESGTALPQESLNVTFHQAPDSISEPKPTPQKLETPSSTAAPPLTLTILEDPSPTSGCEGSAITLHTPKTDRPESAFRMPLLTEDPRESLRARQGEIQTRTSQEATLRAELDTAQSLDQLKALQTRWQEQDVPAPQRAALMARMRRQGGFSETTEFYQNSVERNPEFGKLEIPFLGYADSLNKSGRPVEALIQTERFLAQPNEERCEATTAKLLSSAGEAYKRIGVDAEEQMTALLEKSSLVGFAQSMAGTSEQWEGGREKAMQSLNVSVQNYLDGRVRAKDVASLLGELTGTSFESPLAEASIRAGLETHRKEVSSRPADTDAVRALRAGAGRPVGSDLLSVRRAAFATAGARFSEAFHTNFDPRAGSEYVRHLLETGHPMRAAQMARVVQVSSERSSQNDARGRQALLEVSLMTNDHGAVSSHLPEAMGAVQTKAEIEEIAGNVSRLRALRQASGGETRMLDFAETQLKLADTDRSTDDEYHRIGRQGIELAESLTEVKGQFSHLPTERLRQRTFHFRDVNSKFVGGNISFGGSVPDITVNQKDIQLARKLLKGLDLDRAPDFETWHKGVDSFLQLQYGLQSPDGKRPLEDLQSPQHKALDEFREGLKDLAGAGKTSLMVEMLLGKGDCRHVAYSKQLLFDVWKGDLQNSLFTEAVSAAEKDQFQLSDQKLEQARALERQQLVVAAMKIDAGVELKNGEKYNILKDDQGRPVAGKVKEIESHTLNLLLEFDDQGQLRRDGVTAKDSFYQTAFPLKDAPLTETSEGWRTKEGVMGTTDAAGEKIPFFLRFSHYSGNGPKNNDEECGLTLLGGLPVNVTDRGQLIPE